MQITIARMATMEKNDIPMCWWECSANKLLLTAKGTIHDTAPQEQLFSMICKVERKCTLWGNSTLVYSQNKGVMGASKDTRETVIAELFLKAENWKQL